MSASGPDTYRTEMAARTSRAAYVAWRTTAILAAVFCTGVAVAMLVRDLATRTEAPLTVPALTELKQQLAVSPNDEALKQRIRNLDLKIRRDYFTKLRFKQTGAWLLVAGLAVLVLSAREAARLCAALPQPGPTMDASETALRHAALARRTAILVGAVVLAVALGLAASVANRLPSNEGDLQKLLAKLNGQATEESLAHPWDVAEAVDKSASWPRFLGPAGNAFTTNAAIPDAVDPTSGTGICWRADVDAQGYSSPVTWGNRVFLTGGDATNRFVLCYDANSGALLWRRLIRDLPGSPAKQPDIPEGTGFAASSPATDGQRVYAIFGNGDLAALKLDGTVVWGRNIGVPDNPYGHAQSLATWQGRLIIPLDQGEAEKNRSRLFMLDSATGKVVWEKVRPVSSSWATPIVIDAAGSTQIITLGGAWVIAYGAKDGSELWRVECLSGEITPSPIFVGGFVIALSPSDRIVAIRPGGRGDVTKTHVAWSYEDNIPDISSPVSNGDLVFLASSPGVVTCLEVKSGEKLWEQDYSFEVNATPAVANDKLVLPGKKGLVVVIRAGREFKELGRFDLGEEILASPAIAAGKMFLRTTRALYCIGSADPKPPATQSQ